ncbi:MAG: helix-turn-helix transcriptional regulator [Lachnospiraceae bacterium]
MEALLASLRKNAGLTQDMAAKELGVCQSTISMWESGASKPRIEMLKRIATVYNCDITQLLESAIN